MTANSDDIYIKADRNIEVAKKSVTLGDVLKIECSQSCKAGQNQKYASSDISSPG